VGHQPYFPPAQALELFRRQLVQTCHDPVHAFIVPQSETAVILIEGLFRADASKLLDLGGCEQFCLPWKQL
jgi:hypothetical protein